MEIKSYSQAMANVLLFHAATAVSEVHNESGPLDESQTRTFYKKYPRFPAITLVQAPQGRFLDRLPSKRVFSSELRPDLTKLAWILSGLQEKNQKRRYPSAGARYSLEAHLVSWSVEGLKSGVYHYDVKAHALECMLQDCSMVNEESIVSPHVTNPPCAIILTSCLPRNVIKYGDRGYIYALVEAGHVGQMIITDAATLGLETCCVGGFVDRHLGELLDLTDQEVPLYVIAIGH
jgi:SagB-type dehydrogenase family enzyme